MRGRLSRGTTAFVKLIDLYAIECVLKDGHLIHATIQVADGEAWTFAERLPPIADLSIADPESLDKKLGAIGSWEICSPFR